MKEFKQRHLDFTQIFTSESDYIFYAISVTPERKINSQINIDHQKKNKSKEKKKSCTAIEFKKKLY